MAYNFLRGDRDQLFLLPPDLRDWLPDGHLAWFILDVTETVEPWRLPGCKVADGTALGRRSMV